LRKKDKTMIEELGLKVKKASKEVAKLSTADKNVFLQKLADSLIENTDRIIYHSFTDNFYSP